MYIEVARRQSGKTKRLIEEAINTLRMYKNCRILIVSPTENMGMDIKFRIKKLCEDVRFLSLSEYERIEFKIANWENWLRAVNPLMYKKIFFDEFAFIRYLIPVENGYYVSSAGNIENLHLLTRYTSGRYYVRKITFKLLKKEHERKSKTNLSRQR